jgi:hypothetical protein
MDDAQGFGGRLRRGRPGEPLAAGGVPPKKIAWLRPVQLVRTVYHAWLRRLGSEYIDRREMFAALDPRIRFSDTSPSPPSTLKTGDSIDALVERPEADENQSLWIDFVADVGDSWEATYAVASMLVDPDLGKKLQPSTNDEVFADMRPADIVVLGGDLVYPAPSRNGYRRRLRAPFAAARPGMPARDCILAIPGQRDWFDGLTNFVRELCQTRCLGSWHLVQRRSYFAVKLIKGWWLWGIDIALDTRIDPPQLGFFRDVLTRSNPPEEAFDRAADRIILCTAKPAWLAGVTPYPDEAYRNLAFFITEIIQKDGYNVPVVLAGDLHQYCRYANGRGNQLIVAGGGGAYATGTHFLPDRVPKIVKQKSTTLDSETTARPADDDALQPDTAESFTASRFTYPSRTDSRRLALGALLLAARPANWQFCLAIGALIFWIGWMLEQARGTPVRLLPIVAGVVALCGTVATFGKPGGSRFLKMLGGGVHGSAHIVAAILIALFVTPFVARVVATTAIPRQAIPYAVIAIVVIFAGFVGGTVVALYLVISDRWFNMHHNEVFAVQSITDYRSFVRMTIRPDGSLILFPIGLRRVPSRWRRRLPPQPDDRLQPDDPLYEPADEVLAPTLIEGPIRVIS